jgi:septal ring factor EnvC (AmiA/AmiB activator)
VSCAVGVWCLIVVLGVLMCLFLARAKGRVQKLEKTEQENLSLKRRISLVEEKFSQIEKTIQALKKTVGS